MKPEIAQIHKDTAMINIYADLLEDLTKPYFANSHIAFRETEGQASPHDQDEAAVVVGAFSLGAITMAASYLKVGTLNVDFDKHPGVMLFGLEVSREVLDRGGISEDSMRTWIVQSQIKGTRAAHAHGAGQKEGWQIARTLMSGEDSMNRDAIKNLLTRRS